MAQEYSYTAVFEVAEEGGYVVTFPAIPGLATQGETIDEARGMAADCLRAFSNRSPRMASPQTYETGRSAIVERVRGAPVGGMSAVPSVRPDRLIRRWNEPASSSIMRPVVTTS